MSPPSVAASMARLKATTASLLIVAPPPTFAGSTQNGVTSSGYGPFQGAFKIVR